MSRLTIATRGNAAALPLTDLLAIIPSLPRPLLGRLVTRMIDRMDEIDGDPDLEPETDLCTDDAGEQEEYRHRGIRTDLPRYGVNQTLGPINEAEAWRNFARAQCGRADDAPERQENDHV